jgi:HEAT repeat protein
VVLALVTASACTGDAPPPASSTSRYTVVLDLTDSIAKLGADDAVDEAVEHIAQMGPAAVPALQTALAREGTAIRLAVIQVLEQIDGAEALGVLAHVAAGDAEPQVRATAVLALGDRSDAAVRPALESALADGVTSVRQTAAVACGARCTSIAAVDRMIDIALGDFPETDLPRMRASLARLLAGTDRDAAGHARTRLVERTTPMLEAAGPLDTRARAALFATLVEAPASEAVLVETVRESKNVGLRTAAIGALTQDGTAAAVSALAAGANDPLVNAALVRVLRAIAARNVPEAKDALARIDGMAAP